MGREAFPGMIAHLDAHPLRVPWTEVNLKTVTFPRSHSHPPSCVNSQATERAVGCSKLESTRQNHL